MGTNLSRWIFTAGKAIHNYPPPVSGNGDLNGDGFADLAVGAPMHDGKRGRAMVFYGGREGLHSEPDWVLDGRGPGEHRGIAVCIAGDLNGDSIDDLVLTERHGNLDNHEGPTALHVFLGSTNGLPASPSQTLSGTIGNFTLHSILLNHWLAPAGDVNGDGYADIAVTAVDPEWQGEPGVLLVFHGSPEGIGSIPAWVAHSEQENSAFPATFSRAGDVNGDGFGDLIVGAMKFTGRHKNGGKACLYLGSAFGLKREPAWTSEYPLPVNASTDYPQDFFFSCGLASAGDVNRDGFDDVLVGAWFASHGDLAEGAAFLYFGEEGGLSAQPVWSVEGNQMHIHLGASMDAVGDLNGDGFGDVIIGTPYVSHGQKDEGIALVYHGSKSGLDTDAAWAYESDRSHGNLGERVAAAGDLNGDGFPDIMMSGADQALTSEAYTRVTVVYGSEAGLPHPSSWRPDKPLLTWLQQRVERLSRRTGWLLILGITAAIIVTLLAIQFRLRRRLAAVVEENRRLAASQERMRIGRDLHDHLGADLTQIAASLDRCLELSSSSDQKVVRELHETVKTTLENLDEVVWLNNGKQDNLEGLASYLGGFAFSFLEGQKLTCELDFPAAFPSFPLSAHARHNLFLIAKEALNNVVRHANASKVRVSLSVSDGLLCLSIADNGSGFGLSTDLRADRKADDEGRRRRSRSRAYHGNGLSNMQTRAAALNASLTVESSSDGGALLTVRMPLGHSRRGSNNQGSR